MGRQLRITNLIFGMVAFAVGVGFAGLFAPDLNAPSPESTAPPLEERTQGFQSRSRLCGSPGLINTESESALQDAIRTTELKLIEVRKQSSADSPRVRELKKHLQRQLEERLERLLDKRKRLFKEQLRRMEDEGGTKLVYREVCYEN